MGSPSSSCISSVPAVAVYAIVCPPTRTWPSDSNRKGGSTGFCWVSPVLTSPATALNVTVTNRRGAASRAPVLACHGRFILGLGRESVVAEGSFRPGSCALLRGSFIPARRGQTLRSGRACRRWPGWFGPRRVARPRPAPVGTDLWGGPSCEHGFCSSSVAVGVVAPQPGHGIWQVLFVPPPRCQVDVVVGAVQHVQSPRVAGIGVQRLAAVAAQEHADPG